MSNTTIVDPYITTLNKLQATMTFYAYSIFCVIGNIGSILNIIVLLKPAYRRNSCSSYILANTFANLINLNLFVAYRFLGETSLWLNRVPVYCKLRSYTVQAGSTVSRLYLALACIDRWALTSRSVRIRSFAQIKVSRVVIPASLIIWLLLTIHGLIYYDVTNGFCAIITKTYSIFYNISNTIMSGFIVPGCMIVFSALCIRNVRKLRQRVHVNSQSRNVISINEQNLQQNLVNKKAYDYQLTFMVLIQIVVYIITNIPFIANLFYGVITINWTKSALQLTIDSFWANIVQILVYLNFALTFYIYTLTASAFRKDLKQLFCQNDLMNKIFRRG